MHVSKRIKSEMVYMGLRPKDMAKSCGVTERTWFLWMKNPGTITLDHLSIIAARLKVPMYELLKER